MAIDDVARQFFDACETGKGWEVCQTWCQIWNDAQSLRALGWA